MQNLPLEDFFTLLKQNGFSVTPAQIINANRVILQYASWVKNETSLCMYLAPLFAGSEDEQQLFKKLFTEHFKTNTSNNRNSQNQKKALAERVKQNWKSLLAIYSAVALLVILVIVITSLHHKTFDPSKVGVLLYKKSNQRNAIKDSLPIQTKTSNNLELLVTCTYDKKPSELETEVLYNWGDGTPSDALPSHIYLTPGHYGLTAFVNVLYRNNSIKTVTLRRTVNVCSLNNNLTIGISPNGDSRITGEKIKLNAVVNGQGKAKFIKWDIDGIRIDYGKTIELSFNEAGSHYVQCTVVYDSINSPCNIEQYTQFNIQDKKDFSKPATKADSVINKPTAIISADSKNSKFLPYLYISLAIVFLLLAVFFMIVYAKELKKAGILKSAVLEKYKKLSASLGSQKTPSILPFRSKNYLPVHEAEVGGITKLMRRRVKDSITFLHIGKTITRSIEKGGFFDPVREARTRQSEYLLLIDEYNTNSQQVKLFEYLAALLKRHNVITEVFYFNKTPAFCYNSNEPQGISLEKLYNKHQRHILLILGYAHQLINTAENKFDADYETLLQHWQHKAVITPVSFLDWQEEERKILLPHIPVVPADIEGLSLLAESLTAGENGFDIIARLNRNKGVFYKVSGINFESTAALLQYCNDASWAKIYEDGKPVNVLFEWIAALAVYPKIRWEITLALGNVISEKYGLRKHLNFTTLLRIVRISWMKKGVMPGELRFELLKKLSPENEKLARETILMLLKEIPEHEIKEEAANYQEKEIQQVVNEFSLYAHDPVYYSSYRQSKYMFENIWKNRQLNDLPTEQYFKNDNNAWQTLINNQHYKTGVTSNVSVEEYLLSSEKEETILSKVYLALSLVSLVVVISCIGALRVLYIWNNFL